MKYIFYLFSLCFLAVSCNTDDDICVSGDATPRMKVKFRTLADQKIKTLDSVYVDVDFGNVTKTVIAAKSKDSILIPLRVDDNNFTNFYLRTTYKGNKSQIKVSYTTQATYVSPACGIKKDYYNVSSELVTSDAVKKVVQNQTQIVNEDKTVLYLDF